MEKRVNICIFTVFDGQLTGYQKQLADFTGGKISNGFDEFTDGNIYEYVFGKKSVARECLHAILASGYQPIVLDTLLYPNGKNPSGTDTDTDGLTDWDEVYNEMLTFDESGRCVLPTVYDCMHQLGNVPFYVEGYVSKSNIASFYGGFKVLPIRSNPTCEDSDGDGLLDGKPQEYNNNMIAPKDNSPLMYDGPKNAWINHIKTSKTSMSTEYSSNFGSTVSGVVNKFLTIIDNTINIEFDTVDSRILHVDFSIDAVIKIPYKSLTSLLQLFMEFCRENAKYISIAPSGNNENLWVSFETFNEVFDDICPYFEIKPNQFADFIQNFCDFIDRKWEYIESIIDSNSDQTFDIELIVLSDSFEINADDLVDLALYTAPVINSESSVWGPISKGVKAICEGSTVLGARALNFVLDENGVAYHSQPDTWQRAFGYNDLYDLIFEKGAYMDKVRYDFKSNGVSYALWMWKGDYWNLQGGAEIGLYYIDESRHQISETDHYYCMDNTLPMSLSLYNRESNDNHTNVFCWYPDVDPTQRNAS